ncbi:hypothetical protein [Chitinilyticum litopenaei]|uniref:hypothetical protein n=1 Tax=Chitinilyticum litopenaei TaxID=1121276 RepID=UPI000684F9B4|nr:hypothetical protein [Chitinilyticum litopenaei]
MQRIELELFADYFQFYLQDEDCQNDLSEAWTAEAVRDLLAVAPGIVGVGTMRNMDVPVAIDLREGEPDIQFGDWDHISEFSIDVPSGKLVVAGCSDYFPKATRIPLEPGSYQGRVLCQGLATLSEDGLEGQDHYTVQLWPGTARPGRVIKAWQQG